VHLVATKPIARTEPLDRREHLILEPLAPLEVGLATIEIGEKLADERTDGRVELGRSDSRAPVFLLVE
jgi:hypothetical protein